MQKHTKTQVQYAVWCVLVSIWFPHFAHKHAQSTVQLISCTVQRIQLQWSESTRTAEPSRHRRSAGGSRLLYLRILLQHPVFVGVDAVCELEDEVGIGRRVWRLRRNVHWHYLSVSHHHLLNSIGSFPIIKGNGYRHDHHFPRHYKSKLMTVTG